MRLSILLALMMQTLVMIFITEGASQSGVTLGGSWFTDLSVYHLHREEKKDSLFSGGVSTLNLNMGNRNHRFAKVEADIDITLLYGAQADYYAQMSSVTPTIGAGGNTPVLFDIRKLYGSLYFPFGDITVGRQIINFGKGRLFSPIDVFSTVDLFDIGFRRSGSDMVGLNIPFGALSGIDGVFQIPVGSREHSSALKFFGTLGNTDLSLVGIYRHKSQEIITGLSAKGDLEVGWTAEIVGHITDTVKHSYIEAMAGIDYSFLRGDLVVAGEYLYRAENATAQDIYGTHNCYLTAQYAFNEIQHISAMIMHNFTDSITLGAVQYFWNILQNVNAIAYIHGYHNLPVSSVQMQFPDIEYSLRLEISF